jgi:hypothetical protein
MSLDVRAVQRVKPPLQRGPVRTSSYVPLQFISVARYMDCEGGSVLGRDKNTRVGEVESESGSLSSGEKEERGR